MPDMKQAGAVVAALRDADSTSRPIDPTLPLRLEQARREVEASFARFQRGDDWLADAASGGLIAASLSGLARWLKNQDEREDA
jgi:hypothetical protein